jgi:hypothetical protein
MKASTDKSNRSGSSCPACCATTTGQITASVRAHRGTAGAKAQAAKAATAIAARIRSTADSDGSVTAAMIAISSVKGTTSRRTSSASDHD